MLSVVFRLYEELNDYLPECRRKCAFVHTYRRRSSVKELIKTLGVPFGEVDLILVNGESVDPEFSVSDGDRVAVYPVFESFDIASVSRLRPRPLRRVRFVIDHGLDQLGRDLRLLGFDACSADECCEEENHEPQQARILLTREPRRLQQPELTRCLLVRAHEPRMQLDEVIQRLDLGTTETRCLQTLPVL